MVVAGGPRLRFILPPGSFNVSFWGVTSLFPYPTSLIFVAVLKMMFNPN